MKRIGFFLLLAATATILRAADMTNTVTNVVTNTVTNTVSAVPRYRVAVCDWMILKRQKLGAFQFAKQIAADGVEVDIGPLGQRETFENSLTNSTNCQAFLDEARKLGLEISSIAMSGFYAQSFGTRSNYQRLLQDCIDTMKAMHAKIAFMPLRSSGDLVTHPEVRPQVIERLKVVGKMAEQAGVVIGIDSQIDADSMVKLLDEVGSPAIQVYYNLATPIENKRDIIAELKKIGKNRLCQIHFSNTDGVWLQNDPAIDAPKIKAALDEMGWSGWLVIERSRDKADVKNRQKNYGANAAYLKSVFQKP